MEELAKTVDKAVREENMKQLYDTMKKLSGKCSKPERLVKDEEGKTVTEIQELRKGWVEHFGELFNMPALTNPPHIEAAYTDPVIDITSSTIEEIRMDTRQMKSGKSAGPDNIPTEAL
ncbi:unnamed protein product [Schistosoma margrebowiei]|uniref:Uncharacterized protein n=1 Tax=Schistosoma margrebowiei TaxID=48269 RepID=A0A183MTR4_9TREM|nr:unnamed protein product [Schistosoma margrebowiei]